MEEFAYLHCHSIYSVQDGMATHKDYVDAIYEYNQHSSKYHCVGFANTDHGNISGFVKHYNACRKPDKPERKTHDIYGCEIYHCIDVNINPNKDRFHLILLAATQEGLTNLYQIVSHAGTNIIKGRSKDFPVTDLQFMKTHGKGIICLTACLAGIVPQCILNGSMFDAEKYLDFLCDTFDEVYLEVQPHETNEQILVNDAMVELADRKGLKLVMTTDTHYINKTDSQYHDLLKNMCHQSLYTTKNHLYTPEEMEAYCIKYSIPTECITNSGEIAHKCQVDIKPKDHRALLPVFPCPAGYDESSYLRKLSYEKLNEKIIKNGITEVEKYLRKMMYELEIICNAGFAGYFLILWDWFEWCRKNDILCGPGRGSAAGSIVSYVLNITKVDPIKNGFFFERFLNPGRVEFPDIDTDIPRSRRADAIKYLLGKYGVQNVSQIITFGQYKLKNTVKSVLSSLNVPFDESNTVTRNIPDMVDGRVVTYDLIEDVYNNPDDAKYVTMTTQEISGLRKNYEELQELFRKYPLAYQAIKHITGCIANTGIHAGGVIVCNKPINENAGIIAGSDTAVLPLIMFEMTDLDFFGFLKIDVLGLKTLDVIKETMDLAGLDYDWYDSEDFVDDAVYEMLRNGDTCDVFQLSTFSPTKMVADFDTRNIDDICAVNAGNRPGPLEKDLTTGKSMVDLYVERKKSGVIDSLHPLLDPVLANTMGCLWYQEQCISIGQIMAGYDLGSADLRIRKTLGKKLKKKIPEIKNEFVYGKQSEFDEDHNVIGMKQEDSEYCVGSIAKGFTEELSLKMFDSMEAFAKYCFNRSHSFCYAVVAFKTAWLSYHHPLEFAVANCTVNEDIDKITATLALAKKRQIPIAPPDINRSETSFSIDGNSIRYGLKAIKGLGASVLTFIDEYKNQDTVPFKDFDDYYGRIHGMNPIVIQLVKNIQVQTGKNSPNPMKKDVEVALILSGAFDYAEPNRYKLLNHYIVDIRKEKKCKVMGKDEDFPMDEKGYVRKVKLALEQFYMGAYISEHPLDPFPYESFESATENQVIQTSGMITSLTMKTTKTGKDYLSFKFVPKDDVERTVNLFNEQKAQELRGLMKKNQIVIVKGKVSKRWNNINADSVRIVTFKKQQNAIDLKDIEVEDKTQQVQPVQIPVSDESFASIF